MQIAAVRLLRLSGTMRTDEPYQEYLVKWNAINQHFLAHPLVPEYGMLRSTALPGLGMDLDAAKIEQQAALDA
jgi:hypothetical protein